MIKEILRDYQYRRDTNEREAEDRKKALYEQIPQLQELDDKRNKMGLKALKATMQRPKEKDEINAKLEAIMSNIAERRKQIFLEHKIPLDYLDTKYDCMECKDRGFLENGTKCKCLQQKLITASYRNSNMENTLVENNFDNFDFNKFSDIKLPNEEESSRDRIEYIYKEAKSFIENFNTKNIDNLLFLGNVGVGKTYMSSCIAKELIDQNKTVIYQKTSNIVQVLERNKFNKEATLEDRESYDRLFNCDLLIIDDLGTELINTFTISELFNIIDTRLINKKKIIISTNLDVAALNEVYGARIFSRMAGSFKFLTFLGKDLRWEV